MGCRATEVVAIVLSCAWTMVFALPASPPSTSAPSGLLYQSSNISLSKPPEPAACSDSMGSVTRSDCIQAINLLPHDPPMRPVLRNFYTAPSDVSPGMPNQQVPFEKTYGDCTAQVVLATNVDDVRHDQTSWINLIGPARILMRDCADKQGYGGALVRNGNLGNLEVVLYNRQSIYGKVHTLKNSPDPVAVAIANQELLELLHLAPNIYDEGVELLNNATSSVAAQALSLTR